MRFGDECFPIAVYDVIICPISQYVISAQIVNTSQVEPKIIALRSMYEPNTTEYPDAKIIGIVASFSPGGDHVARTFSTWIEHAEIVY